MHFISFSRKHRSLQLTLKKENKLFSTITVHLQRVQDILLQGGGRCASEILQQPSGREQSAVATAGYLYLFLSVQSSIKKKPKINAFNNCLNCYCAFCRKWFMDNHQFVLLITLTSSMYYSEQRMTIYLTAFGRKICCVPQLYKEH